MKLLHAGLWMSLTLGLIGCSEFNPPCNREDVLPSYDIHGNKINAITLTRPCYDRIRGDLEACYPKK